MELLQSIRKVLNKTIVQLLGHSNGKIIYTIPYKDLNMPLLLTSLTKELTNKVWNMKEISPSRSEYQYAPYYKEYNLKDHIPHDTPKLISIIFPLDMYSTERSYILTLRYKPVNIYLSDKLIPVDVINFIIGSIMNNKDFINLIKSVDTDPDLITYEIFYKNRYLNEYGKVRHVVNEVYKITNTKPWKRLYIEKLERDSYDGDTYTVLEALKIYDIAPTRFDNIVKVFVDYHLGDKDDYKK